MPLFPSKFPLSPSPFPLLSQPCSTAAVWAQIIGLGLVALTGDLPVDLLGILAADCLCTGCLIALLATCCCRELSCGRRSASPPLTPERPVGPWQTETAPTQGARDSLKWEEVQISALPWSAPPPSDRRKRTAGQGNCRERAAAAGPIVLNCNNGTPPAAPARKV